MMTLYGHPDSGHAYKIALALSLGKIDYDYEWVDIWAPCETRAEAFRNASKWCEVPCLVWNDRAYIQSGAILLMLVQKLNLLDGKSHLDNISEWVLWEANRIGMCVPQLIHTRRAPLEVPKPVVEWLLARYDTDIQRLNTTLENQEFVAGQKLSVADIAIYGYLSKAHMADLQIPKFVATWIKRIKNQAGFQNADALLAKP